MESLTPDILSRGCQIFLALAYPGGLSTIPEKKQPYAAIPLDRPVSDFLPPAKVADGICHVLSAPGGGMRGFAFRLGSERFPHLKLKLQLIDYDNTTTWVFMVDTHDAFSRSSFHPPPDHPDAKSWRELQMHNRKMKERIEAQLEAAGLETFNSLLRRDLERSKATSTDS